MPLVVTGIVILLGIDLVQMLRLDALKSENERLWSRLSDAELRQAALLNHMGLDIQSRVPVVVRVKK